MTLIIRHAGESDFEALRAMHRAQGFAYTLPDLASNDWALKAVLEQRNGRPEAAVLLRRTAETYLLMGNGGTRRERLGKLLALQQDVSRAAKENGICECQAFLPPEIELGFGKLLLHIGWKKSLWPSYFKEL